MILRYFKSLNIFFVLFQHLSDAEKAAYNLRAKHEKRTGNYQISSEARVGRMDCMGELLSVRMPIVYLFYSSPFLIYSGVCMLVCNVCMYVYVYMYLCVCVYVHQSINPVNPLVHFIPPSM